MLWRMSADTREQRIGIMGISIILSAIESPPTTAMRSLAALRMTVLLAAWAQPLDGPRKLECTPKVRQIKPGQFLRRGTDEATIERNG
jgi:hypothetical protein